MIKDIIIHKETALRPNTPDHPPALVPLPQNTCHDDGLGLFLGHSNLAESLLNFTPRCSSCSFPLSKDWIAAGLCQEDAQASCCTRDEGRSFGAEAGEGDVVPCAAFGFVRPKGSLGATDADFSNGFGVSHDVFPPENLRVCERFHSPAHGGNGQTLMREEQRRRSQ